MEFKSTFPYIRELYCKTNIKLNISNYKFNVNRRCITDAMSGSPVKLSFSVYQSSKPCDSLSPIIILHGLLGSKQNWKSLAKAIAVKSRQQVITLDARNHGDSPHSEFFNYSLMALDLKHFMISQKISNAIIIGHSMGGRTAMTLALKEPQLVNKLVVVDVSPKQMPACSASVLPSYMSAMKEAITTVSQITRMTEARKIVNQYLAKTIPEDGLRQFLLTNLVEVDGVIKWKVNLDVLQSKFESGIMAFPLVSGFYPEETLFICGGNSSYIKMGDYPFIKSLFPKAEFIVVPGAGHWVHSEKPIEFIDTLFTFI